MSDFPLDADALRAWIVDYVASALGIDREAVSPSAPFDSYGLDSAEAVIMAGAIEEEFNVEIDPNILFEDPSINGFVAALQAGRMVVVKPR